jgi:hypothetical protein
MLDQTIIEFINADMDGELGPNELIELEAIFNSSPEAVQYRDELLKLNGVLKNLPELDPPVSLTHRILSQVQLPLKKQALDVQGFFARYNPIAAGLAFAAGLLVTVGIYETGSRKLMVNDTVSMVGTMVANKQVGVPGQGHSLSLDLDDLSGTVSLNRDESGQTLEFDLDSQEAIEIELDLVNAGLMVAGFAQDNSGDGSLIETLEILGGTMRVVNQGRHHFVVFLKNSPDSNKHGKDIRIGISQDGQRIYEHSLGS